MQTKSANLSDIFFDSLPPYRSVLAKFALFSVILWAVGCTSFSRSVSIDSEPKKNEQNRSSQDLPFVLEVVDEVNDGERLHVLGAVTAQTDWMVNDVVVRLTGMRSGEQIGISYLPLRSNLSSSQAGDTNTQIIKAQEKYSFSVSVPSQNITDYQLELLWGDEAKRHLKNIEVQKPGSLELRQIEVLTKKADCPKQNCGVVYKMTAQLFNSGATVIDKVVLGVGFLVVTPGQKLDFKKQIPQNEERIELSQLALMPGASRPLSLDFDEPVTEEKFQSGQGELRPNIRIVSFSSKSEN